MRSKYIFPVLLIITCLTFSIGGITQENSINISKEVKFIKVISSQRISDKNEKGHDIVQDLVYVGSYNTVLKDTKVQFYVIIDNNISYYNQNNELIEEKHFKNVFDYIVVSNDGNYIFGYNFKQKRCKLENIKGEILWETAMPLRLLRNTSNFNLIHVTRDGKVILPVDGSKGALYTYPGCENDGLAFLDRNGVLTEFGTVKNYELKNLGVANNISSEGNYLAINYVHSSGGSYVRFYDLVALKELWVHRFKASSIGGLAVSPNGNYIIVVTGARNYERKNQKKNLLPRSIYFIKKDGTIINEVNCSELGNVAVYRSISPDGDFITFTGVESVTRDGVLYLFEVATGKLLWKYTVNQGGIFGPVCISKDAEIIVSECGSPQGLLLLIFNKNGEVIFNKNIINVSKNILSIDGSKLWSIDRKGNIFNYHIEN